MKIEPLSATEADAIRVGSFLLAFAAEHRFGSLPTVAINTERAWERIWRMLDDGAVWIATEDDGAIAGSIAVSESELWWTDVSYLSDGWLFVSQDMRGSVAAAMLIEAATAFAKELELPLVIKVFHAGNPALVGKFLGRMGFSMLGGTFIREP